jgi:predicted TIM-barrel fold metal-dependent hydrolase
MIVDIHTHAFPDFVAATAVRRMENAWNIRGSFDGTLKGLRVAIADAGVSMAVLQPVATTPESVRGINDWVAGLSSSVLVPFGALHPDMDDPEGEIARLASLGVRGFKLHPGHQGFSPGEKRLQPIYDAAAAHGLIVFTCAGHDEANRVVQSTPEMFARVVERNPELRLVIAHLGGYRQWPEVRRHLVGLPVWLETSYTLRPLGDLLPAEFVELVTAHGADRVVFGSDAPLADIASELKLIRGSGLEADQLDMVLGGTAMDLLGL